MKHRSIIAALFWLIAALVVAAMISWITDTAWPTVILASLLFIAGMLWLQWPKIAKKPLNRIRDGLEVEVTELVIDRGQRLLRVTFGVRNKHPAKLTLKSIDHVIVRLNKDTEVARSFETESTKVIQFPRCELVKVPMVTNILASCIESLVTNKANVAYWDFKMTLLFDSDWGELSCVRNLEFNQLPRIGGA